jgi:hypothetical protein
MKFFDVFDSKGEWLGTESFADDFPDELVQVEVRVHMTYSPDVWVLPAELADAGVIKARIEWTPTLQEGPHCSFCGRAKAQVPTLVESAVDASKSICGDCVDKLKNHK